MSSRIFWIIFVSFFCFCSQSMADTIYLKNGKVIQGEVVHETSYYITVVEDNKMVDYFEDEVERVEKGESAGGVQEEAAQLIPDMKFGNPKQKLILTLMEVNGTSKDIEARINALLNEVDADKREALRVAFKLEEVLNSLVPIYEKYYTQDELQQIVDFHKSPVGKKVYDVTPDLINDALEAIVKYFRLKFDSVN
ncbi:DUF2059 domain-containing protein [Candidatus Omnitrophota bacterium]